MRHTIWAVVSALFLLSGTVLALPIDKELFKQFSATRDSALGNKIYENAEMIVFSGNIDPKIGGCTTYDAATPINLDEYSAKLGQFMKARGEWDALREKNAPALEAAHAESIKGREKMLQEKNSEFREKLRRLPTGDGSLEARQKLAADFAKEMGDALRHNTFQNKAASILPPQPVPPKQETINLRTSSVTILYKNKGLTEQIVDTDTPFQKYVSDGWERKPAAGVISKARETYLPTIDKLCARIERLDVSLGFYDLVESAEQNFKPSVAYPVIEASMPLFKKNSGWYTETVKIYPASITTLENAMVDWASSKNRVWEAKKNHFYVNGRFIRDTSLPQPHYPGVVIKPVEYWGRYDFIQSFGNPLAIFEGYFRAVRSDNNYLEFLNFFEEFSKQCPSLLKTDAQPLQHVTVKTTRYGGGPEIDETTPGEVVTIKNRYANSYKLAYAEMRRYRARMAGQMVLSKNPLSTLGSQFDIEKQSKDNMRAFIKTEKCESPVLAQMAENFHRHINSLPSLQEEAAKRSR